MAIQEVKAVKYVCSDGTEHFARFAAELREAEIGVEAVCNEHGYSGTMSRGALYALMLEHPREFHAALDAYVKALDGQLAALKEAHEQILFTFEGVSYTAPPAFSDLEMCVLPDGRVLRSNGFLETIPPKPQGLKVVNESASDLPRAERVRS